jgi:predicted nucleic acid-binding protein
MRPVVADTGPLNYLILIEAGNVLLRLFSPVSIPPSVRDELSHPKAPTPVRSWMSHPPAWLTVVSLPSLPATPLPALDQGEREAIALATQQQAALLIDEREGVLQARRMGLEVIGTLAILARAAQCGWVQLPEMFRRLRGGWGNSSRVWDSIPACPLCRSFPWYGNKPSLEPKRIRIRTD